MSIHIKIKHDLHKIPVLLDELATVAMKRAVARSMNDTRTWFLSKGAAIIKQRVNLPIKGTSKGGGGLTPPGIKSLIEINRVKFRKSAPLSDLTMRIWTDSKPISLIHFLQSSQKKPIMQKGVPVNRRLPKRLSAKIIGGRTTRIGGDAFVQRMNGAIQVWRNSKQHGIVKQSYRSIWNMIDKTPTHTTLANGAQERFDRAMAAHVPFYLGKMRAKG